MNQAKKSREIGEATPKQKAFIEEYFKTHNATYSYKKIYSREDKIISDRVAGVEGSTLLKKPRVRRYLERRAKEINEEHQVDRAMLIKYLFYALHANVRNLQIRVDAEGNLIETAEQKELRERTEIYVTKAARGSFTLFKKETAAELIAKLTNPQETIINANIRTGLDASKMKHLSNEELNELIRLTEKAHSGQAPNVSS